MLLEDLEKAIVDHTRSFEARLVLLCRKLGFDHAAYAHLNMTVGVISGFTTYPPAWVSAYTSRNLYEQDPIIRHGLEFTGPVDWAEFRDDARYRTFFDFLAKKRCWKKRHYSPAQRLVQSNRFAERYKRLL